MAHARTFAVLACFTVSASSCTQPGQPAALARADHSLFWSESGAEVRLVVGANGGTWQHGELDAALYPELAKAWTLGQTPRVPLFGRDPGVQLRALDAFPPQQPGEPWRLRAKALSAYPIRITVLADQGGILTPVGAAESEMWNRRSHFARADAVVRIPEGALVAVRVEGAYQAFESLLRLYTAP